MTDPWDYADDVGALDPDTPDHDLRSYDDDRVDCDLDAGDDAGFVDDVADQVPDVHFPDVWVDRQDANERPAALVARVRRALLRTGHTVVADEFVREAREGGPQDMLATCLRWVRVK